MGFLVLGAAIVYLLLSVIVVCLATWFARKCGRNAKWWGWGAVLVMFLIPFWDWLPTIAVHQYYCATQSGFWVYKTLDQWKEENPGVSLHSGRTIQTMPDGGELYILDERFAIETHRRNPIPGLSTKVADRLLVDRKTNEVMAKEVTVGSGYGNPVVTGNGYKFWLSMKPCKTDGIHNIIREIGKMRSEE